MRTGHVIRRRDRPEAEGRIPQQDKSMGKEEAFMPDSQDRLTGDTRPLPRFNRQRHGEDTPPGTDPGVAQGGNASTGEGAGTQDPSGSAADTAQTQPLTTPEASSPRRGSQPVAVVPPPPYPGPVQDQDKIPTPAPRPPLREASQPAPRVRGTHWSLKVLVGIALIIALLSLALNGLLIYRLVAVQQKATESVDRAIATLDKLGQEGFHYEYRFNQTIPFSGDIPFKQDLVFPFEGTIPIDTTIEVPIDAGLVKTTIPVRVNTSVYVNTSVPVSIDETFHISTSIPVDLTIPIDIKPGDPAIQELIGQVREWLVELTKLF